MCVYTKLVPGTKMQKRKQKKKKININALPQKKILPFYVNVAVCFHMYFGVFKMILSDMFNFLGGTSGRDDVDC